MNNPIQSSIQSNPIQSNPIQSNPIQSNPIQSNPIQSNPINNQSKDVMSQLLALEYHRERNTKNQDDGYDDGDDERDVLTRAPPDD